MRITVSQTREMLEEAHRLLIEARERLPELSAFGDENWEEIDRAIEVILMAKARSSFEYTENGEIADMCADWVNGQPSDFQMLFSGELL
jgi:inosine/xanthosine triphosphate pyrophosphatase family protein